MCLWIRGPARGPLASTTGGRRIISVLDTQSDALELGAGYAFPKYKLFNFFAPSISGGYSDGSGTKN